MYRIEDRCKAQILDYYDRMILFATWPVTRDDEPVFPKAIATHRGVEYVTFPSGKHDNAPRGWMKWEMLHAFRPNGYRRWYRPDLGEWVDDAFQGFREAPVLRTAACHESYVRRPRHAH